MSSSDRNIREPASDGLNKDELAADKADENPVAEFSLVGGDLAKAAAEASAANLLAPEEETTTRDDDDGQQRHDR